MWKVGGIREERQDIMDTTNDEEAKNAIFTARRRMQEAIVQLQFAASRAPDIRRELQTQTEHLAEIVEAVLALHHARQARRSATPPDMPNAGT